ncbi:gap junction delta-4 protein [Pungitius pungitius]|uniref:gap junction delta-4 protein n=1 Tax=Pungitius pungitius TaxID=134920 RepID=UPI002E126563
MIFLRILILLLAGYPLYQDEQERFVCNTIQPGCANVCYDLFSPISLFRFWLVQLVTLCLPYFVFVIYVVHKVSKGLTVDPYPPGRTKALPLPGNHQEPFRKTSVHEMAERGGTRCFTGAYILHLLFRTLLEAGFGAAHYYLFGFHIPRRFLCQHPPCTTQVDCYISRPTEKTVMLNFMLGAAALSLSLDVLDFFCAIKRSVKQKIKSRMKVVEKIYEEEQCFLLGMGASRGQEPNAPPAKQEQEEAGLPGSFRKRRGSKGSSAGLALGQETPGSERSSLPHSPGHPGCNSNGNNAYSVSLEEALERDGSEVALCPPEAMRTPRSIRVSKRSRLKPPPPPRRDLGASPREPAVPFGDDSTAICTRRVGQYTLVELGSGTEPHANDEEMRSEWV